MSEIDKSDLGSTNNPNYDPDGEEDADAAEQLLIRIKNGLFGVLYIMSKDVSQASFVAVLGIFIDFVQMVGFAFQKNCGFAWNPASTSWINIVTSPVKAIGVDVGASSSWRTIFYLSLLLVALLMIDAGFVFWQFSQNRFQQLWTLRLLRVSSSALVGPLFIPIIQIFVQQLSCITGSCGSTEMAAVAWIALFVGVVYISLCLILTLTYYPRNPMSGHPFARPSGRHTMYQLALKLGLVIVFQLLGPQNQPWVLIIVYTAGNALLCFLLTLHLPYYNFGFNELRCISFWVQTWVGICLIVSQLLNDPTDQGVAVLLFVTTPLIITLADLVARARRTYILSTSIFDITSPEDIELKARFHLQEFVNFKMKKNVWSGGPTPARSGASDAGSDGASASHQHALPRWGELGEIDYENEEDFAPLVRQAEKWYELGCKRFPTAAMLLLRAQFYLFYCPEHKVIGMNSLTKAEDRDPTLDESFSVYYLRRMHEETFSTDGNNRDIITYIEINKHMLDAKQWDERATKYQLQFWGVLLDPDPDTIKLSMLAGKINQAAASAGESYRRLLKLQTSPPPELLRAYASFLMDVACDEIHAARLLRRADEAEESNTRQSTSNHSQFDGKSASISISGDSRDLGTILTANSIVAQVLGYSRHELQGKNINMIMPDPYSKFHTTFLSRYLESAKAKLLNAAREMFALHKNGYLIQVQLNIRQVASARGSSFLGLIQKLVLKDEIVFLNPAFCITATTSAWGIAHNLTPERLKSATIPISKHVPDFHEHVHHMLTEAGYSVGSATYWLSELAVEGESWKILRIRDSKSISQPLALPAPAPSSARVVHDSRVKFEAPPEPASETRPDIEMVTVQSPPHLSHPHKSALKHHSVSISTEDVKHANFATPASAVSIKSNDDIAALNITSPTPSTTRRLFSTTFSAVLPLDESSPTALDRTESIKSTEQYQPDDDIGQDIDHADVAVAVSEAGTMASSATTSSSLSIRKTLRSFSRSRNIKGLGPTLSRLRSTLLICLFVVCAAALTKYFVMNSLLDVYSTQLNDVNAAGSRRTSALNGAVLAFELLLIKQGLLPSEYLTAVQALLASSASSLSSVHQTLYVDQVNTLTLDQRSHYSTPSVPIIKVEQVGNTLMYTFELMSLSNCIQEIVSATSVISALPLSQIQLVEPHVFFLLQNAFTVVVALNQSTNEYVDTVTLSIQIMKQLALGLILASLLLLAFVIFFVVRPPVYDVQTNKDDVLGLFLEVPAAVVRKFQGHSARRLARLRHDDDDEQVADMNDFGDDEVAGVFGARSNTVVDNRHSKKRESRRSKCDMRCDFQKHFTMLKIMGYLFAALIYFVSTYYYEFFNVQDNLTFSVHEVNYSGLRRTYVRLLDFGLEMMTAQNFIFNSSALAMFPDWTPPISPSSPLQGPFVLPNISYALVLDGVSEFYRIQSALMFGSSFFLTDVPSSTPGMSELLFTSACRPSSAPDCAKFGNGLLTHGLATSLSKYIEVARSRLDAAAMMTQGRPWQFVPDVSVVNSSLNSIDMKWIRQMERTEVYPALLDATQLYANKISVILNDLYSWRLAALVVYITFTVVVYLMFYHPLIWFLSEETRRISAMLLMLPPEVLEKLAHVRQFMTRLATTLTQEDDVN